MSRILIFGDICPDNNYRRLFDIEGQGPFDSSITDFIRTSDFNVANLECPATLSEFRITKTGPNIKALPKDIQVLKNIGINALSLANNHILDYGNQGIRETLSEINKSGLKYFGAGDNEEEARRPLVTKVGSMKIGFLAYAEEEFNLASETEPGANHFDPYISLDQIRNLKKECDKVIVLYHGGIEHYRYPSPELQKKCRAIVDAGADIVTCQHSHCIGTYERHNKGFILYGQGNAAFGYRSKDNNWNEGLIIEYTPEEDLVSLRLLEATPDGIKLADPNRNKERNNEISKDSEVCLDAFELKKKWDKFCDGMKSLDLPLIYGYPKLITRLNRISKNRLISFLKGKKRNLITLEFFRCEAHHEVIRTILENEIKWNKPGQGYR